MLSVRILSYGSTRKVWRARKMRKSSSRRSQEQLQLFECSPNFPSVRCENLHSITIKGFFAQFLVVALL